MAPTLATAWTALPPEGAFAPWGGPAALITAPTLATAWTALPPEGAFAPWGGPAALKVGPPQSLRAQFRQRGAGEFGDALQELGAHAALEALRIGRSQHQHAEGG